MICYCWWSVICQVMFLACLLIFLVQLQFPVKFVAPSKTTFFVISGVTRSTLALRQLIVVAHKGATQAASVPWAVDVAE